MPTVPFPGSLRPRAALTIIFAMRGFLVGSWIARIPAIADHLDVTRSEFARSEASQRAGSYCAHVGR